MPIQRAASTAALAVLMSAAVANAASAELANFPSQRAETAAFDASAKGDNWIATNLFEQARAASDTAANRFNLAVAYESTGRAGEAASLYRAVLAPSQAAPSAASSGMGDLDGRNLAMARYARLHLARIDARHGEPAPAGFEVGASASAFVGGPSSGRVSNLHARRLDDAARSASGE